MNQQMNPQMVKYIATRTFSLGQSGFSVNAGAEVFYDNRATIVVDGQSIHEPKIRGAIRMKWLVTEAEYNPNDLSAQIPVSANMTMRPAEGGNPMNPAPATAPPVVASAQDQAVMDVRAHAQRTSSLNANPPRGLRQVQPGNYRRGTPYHGGNRVEGGGSGYVDAAQVSVVSRGFQTSARTITNLGRTTPGEAISQAERVRIETQPGLSREQMLQQLTPEEQAMYRDDVNSLAGGYVSPQTPQTSEPFLFPTVIEQPSVVGSVAHQQSSTCTSEGINFQVQVGGGLDLLDGTAVSGSEQKPEVSTVESEGITFTTTNGPKRDVSAAQNIGPAPKLNLDTRRKIAKQVCPDFPDLYDFDASERKKIARIQADFEDRPDVIRAIYAAETDAMKAKLVEEFPFAFAD